MRTEGVRRGCAAAALFVSTAVSTLGGGTVVAGGERDGTTRFVAPASPAFLPTDTGALSGVVSDAISGRPIAQAVVLLRVASTSAAGASMPRPVAQFLTDARGRFVFTELPPSDAYSVTASRSGFFTGAYGATGGAAAGSLIVLADGQWFRQANISIWPTSAISGRVVDDHGEPVIGVYVRAMREISVAGTRHLAAAPPVTTDDRGSYRISGLDPGKYLVCVPSVQASVPAGLRLSRATTIELGSQGTRVLGTYPLAPAADAAIVYPSTCHPGTPSLEQATTVDVGFGAEQSAVDFRLQPVRAYRVSGRVEGPPEGLMGLTLRLLPAGSHELGYGAEAATALAAPGGSFTFFGVPPGDYVIDAGGVAVEYTYSPESSAARFADMPGPPDLGSGGSRGSSDLESFSPRTGIRRAGSSGGVWARLPISIGAADVAGIVISLGSAATLSGRFVFDRGTGKPPQRLSVTAEPADGRPSRVGMHYVDLNSAFAIRGLLPGPYFLRVHADSTWVVQSIAAAGRDFTRTPFDLSSSQDLGNITVTMTDRAAEVAGRVKDRQGRPAAGAAVIIFPVDPDAWTRFGLRPDYIRTGRADLNGAFRVQSLPAGDFYVAAVDDSRAFDWHVAGFLEVLAREATRLTIGWGERRTVDAVKVDLP